VKLAEFAALTGAPPKWILNSLPIIGGEIAYSLKNARRLAVARSLHAVLGIPLARAWALAADALARWDGTHPVRVGDGSEAMVCVEIDMPRLLSAFHVRRSGLVTTRPARRAGRPRRRVRDPLAAAREYGLDLSLLRANLGRTREQRLRQLDSMVDFKRRVRRAPRA
jgi:hypothetical protein